MPSIRIGHTPDPDDAFMFYGLSSGRVKMMDNYSYGHVIEDIESLNKRALVGDLEITAISAHAYAYLKDKYFILSSGASMGLNYGPILVTRSRKSFDELRGGVVAVPGKYTTAALLLQMAIKDVETVEANFLSIPEMVKQGTVDGGVLIHEGQLTYQSLGLTKSFDLGKWWEDQTEGLPLPLGLDASRMDLGKDFAQAFNEVFRQSVRIGHENMEEALAYAMTYARGEEKNLVKKFVLMYVNDLTMNMGSRGRKALEFLYESGFKRGLIPKTNPIII
ncbi:MAG: MqnA/MqnD/SBP family protein [Nitrososphaerales archaeon]